MIANKTANVPPKIPMKSPSKKNIFMSCLREVPNDSNVPISVVLSTIDITMVLDVLKKTIINKIIERKPIICE